MKDKLRKFRNELKTNLIKVIGRLYLDLHGEFPNFSNDEVLSLCSTDINKHLLISVGGYGNPFVIERYIVLLDDTLLFELSSGDEIPFENVLTDELVAMHSLLNELKV